MSLVPPPFFLVGPTAVGKTALAVEVAERCGAEILSADAFQVYAGLDLLTAKPDADLLARVPHHLVGTVPLSESLNVARYLAAAREHLDDMAKRGRVALVVGGSGLYVKALTHGLDPLPPAEPEVRAELESLDLPGLERRLRDLDPGAAAKVDLKNRRRVIRAIEICLMTGSGLAAQRTGWTEGTRESTAVRGIFLVRDRGVLHTRIKRRVEEMFRRGVIEEVRKVAPESIGPTAARALGLASIQAHLRGELPAVECVEQMVVATRQYAKRQMTWFRRETIFERVELGATDDPAKLVAAIVGKITGQNANQHYHCN